MSKKVVVAILSIIMIVVMTGCGTPNELIGKWKIRLDMGYAVLTTIFEFKEDGTGEADYYSLYQSGKSDLDTREFKYYFKDTTVHIEFDDGDEVVWDKVEFNDDGTKMTIYIDGGKSLVYERIE